MTQSEINRDEKINFLIEENKKYKALSESNKLNENIMSKMKLLQMENIKLQEQNKDSSFLLNKIKLLQEEVEKKKSSVSEEEKKELELLRSDNIRLNIQIKNMKPGGKADPRKASRQTVISNQNKKNEEYKYKKRAEEMKLFLKKRNMYKDYSAWKKRL